MGKSPERSGRCIFSIGSTASSESISVITSSEGDRSPICRLPVRRTAAVIAIYRITVRKAAISKKSPRRYFAASGWFYSVLREVQFLFEDVIGDEYAD